MLCEGDMKPFTGNQTRHMVTLDEMIHSLELEHYGKDLGR